MCEPLSVGVHACRRAHIGPETNVLVMGAGPIGLVTLLAARAFGAPKIVIVDVDDHRLSVAKNLGADDIVKVSTKIEVTELGKFPQREFFVRALNLNIECSLGKGSSCDGCEILRLALNDFKILSVYWKVR